MLTTKHSVTHPFCQTLIEHYKLVGFNITHVRNKHTLGWHVMQTYCAQQRSVELSRIRLFLYGGERINRTTLLYTPFPANMSSRNRTGLKYALPTGMHITLEELRLTGELVNNLKQTDFYTFPQDLHVKQLFGDVARGGWESTLWLSRPEWTRNRNALLQMANRLLMRRGVQADLGETYARTLNQLQPHRLQSRLENFHPQGSKLLELQRYFISRYSAIFFAEQSPYGLPVLRERALPGLHENRRVRRRRSKLRGLSTSRGLLELRPRLGTGVSAQNMLLLARPQQLPFLNMLSLLSRQVLRSAWRRRRGLGLLRRTLRKSGRLIWDLPMCNYLWPLSQRSLRLSENSVSNLGHSLFSTPGVCSLYRNNLSTKKTGHSGERLLRAFPFLFQPREGQEESIKEESL
jgi:hypothetical protein